MKKANTMLLNKIGDGNDELQAFGSNKRFHDDVMKFHLILITILILV